MNNITNQSPNNTYNSQQTQQTQPYFKIHSQQPQPQSQNTSQLQQLQLQQLQLQHTPTHSTQITNLCPVPSLNESFPNFVFQPLQRIQQIVGLDMNNLPPYLVPVTLPNNQISNMNPDIKCTFLPPLPSLEHLPIANYQPNQPYSMAASLPLQLLSVSVPAASPDGAMSTLSENTITTANTTNTLNTFNTTDTTNNNTMVNNIELNISKQHIKKEFDIESMAIYNDNDEHMMKDDDEDSDLDNNDDEYSKKSNSRSKSKTKKKKKKKNKNMNTNKTNNNNKTKKNKNKNAKRAKTNPEPNGSGEVEIEFKEMCQSTLKCVICEPNVIFDDRDAFIAHFKTHYPKDADGTMSNPEYGKYLSCPICEQPNAKHSHIGNLISHLATHDEFPRPYTCIVKTLNEETKEWEECGQTFTTEQNACSHAYKTHFRDNYDPDDTHDCTKTYGYHPISWKQQQEKLKKQQRKQKKQKSSSNRKRKRDSTETQKTQEPKPKKKKESNNDYSHYTKEEYEERRDRDWKPANPDILIPNSRRYYGEKQQCAFLTAMKNAAIIPKLQ